MEQFEYFIVAFMVIENKVRFNLAKNDIHSKTFENQLLKDTRSTWKHLGICLGTERITVSIV